MADEEKPVVDPNAAPGAVPTAAAADAPAAEAPKAPEPGAAAPEKPAFQSAHDEPTLLEQAQVPGAEEPKVEEKPKVEEPKTEEKPPVEAKPGEEKPAAAEKPAEAEVRPEDKVAADAAAAAAAAAKPVEQPKVELPPVEYKYELPESVKINDEERTEFHGALDQFRANPADPTPLIKLYDKSMATYAENLSQEQHRVFSNTRKQWRTEWMADPEIGGNGYQTALGAMARMRDRFASRHPEGTDAYKADLKAFDGFMRVTGAGDHPALARFFHNVAQMFDEPQGDKQPQDINPSPTNSRAPGRRGLLYDHPRSNPQGNS